MAAEEIARQMAAAEFDGAVQLAQTRYRMQLVERWRIPEGARVLEIACGQGDMTAVLAHAVGPSGHVTAIDIADPAYGAPVTLGASAAHLLSSSVGSQIDFHFGFDLLEPAVSFPDDAFDDIVFSHGAWYFADLDQLGATLARVKPWAQRLCFAEWDLEPASFDQVAHLLAVLIQGQIELYKTGSEANVRTPFSKARFLALLDETGWRVLEEFAGDTRELQDADWEIDACLNHALPEARTLSITPKALSLIASQADILSSLTAKSKPRPLPSYGLTADRVQPASPLGTQLYSSTG